MYRVIKTRSPYYLQFQSTGNEQGSTNLIPLSDNFGVWSKQNMTVVNNVSTPIAPDGASTADEVARTSTNASYISRTVSKTTSGVNDYTFSVFVKKGTSRYASVRVQGLYPNRLDAQYDFDNKSFYYVDNYGTDVELIATEVDDYNGWTRIGISFVSDNHSQVSCFVSPKNDSNEGVDLLDSSGDANVYLWGAQLEPFRDAMTSYISNQTAIDVNRAYSGSYNEQEVQLDLSIYSGAHNASPSITYTISKMPTNGMTTFEISELVRDYIEQNSNTSAGTVWVKASMVDGVAFDREYEFIATEGYCTRKDGVQTINNTYFTPRLMQTNTDVIIPEGMSIKVPFYPDSSASSRVLGEELIVNTDFSDFTLTNASIVGGKLNINSTSGEYAAARYFGAVEIGKTYNMIVDVDSFTSGSLNVDHSVVGDITSSGLYEVEFTAINDTIQLKRNTFGAPTSAVINSISVREVTSESLNDITDTDNSIQYFTVNSTDGEVVVSRDGQVISTVSVEIAECSKYSKNMLTFVNKFGAKQDIYFDMKSTERISAKSDEFKRNTLDFSDLTANSLKHTRKRYIKDTQEKFKLNTGYITENSAQAIEELLVSEYVWLTQEDSTVIPVNVTDNNFERMSHLNDGLIQYTINVEASAPYLNNLR